jgi:Fe-coproporphyrin III synthase
MLFPSTMSLLSSVLDIKKYPTADRNASPIRLAKQAIPYYLSRTGFSYPPLSVFIHVNNKCNLRCTMCDQWVEPENSMFFKNLSGSETNNISIKNFKKIIDKIKFFKPFIGIPATEPLMYSNIFEAISYVKSQGLRCSMATNGYLLEQKAAELIDSGLDKIVISVDGPKLIHDKIRGVEGSYQRIIAGIQKLDDLKKSMGRNTPVVYLNYVISEDNHRSLVECMQNLPLDAIKQIAFRVMFFLTRELAHKHNKEWGFRYDAQEGACISGGIDLNNIDCDVLTDQITHVTREYSDKCYFFFKHANPEGLAKHYQKPEEFLDDTSCVFPWYTMQVNPDGDVIAPQRCFFQVFGNLVKQNFEDVWLSSAHRQFRMDLQGHGRFPACARCEGVNY